MNDSERRDIRRQIRNLLFVFGGGILTAFLVAAFFIAKYGPSGNYLLYDALLAPDILNKLSYNDINPKTGKFEHFIFDKVEFSYFDKTWKTVPVDLQKYATFYKNLAKQESILNPGVEIIGLFTLNSSKLSLIVKSDNAKNPLTKVFQEVQFANDENHFRILLHEQSVGQNWVYFYLPGIGKEAFSLFVR